MINEWVSVKVEERVFEVFVKEVGAEVYSVQSHPDRSEEYSESGEETDIGVMAVHPPTESGQSLATKDETSLKLFNGYDPIIDAIINCTINGNHDMECAELWVGLVKYMPLPTGFSPCTLEGHVHRIEARAADSLGHVSETPLEECGSKVVFQFGAEVPLGVGENQMYYIPLRNAVGGGSSSQKEVSGGKTEEEGSDETLYRINPNAVGAGLDVDGAALVDVNDGVGFEVNKEWQVWNDEFCRDSEREVDSCSVDADDDEIAVEIAETKKVWNKSGFFLDSNDEEEITARLVDRKIDGKEDRI
ncbi:hypothetical protein PIB30_006628 [Stylosanthes scabra]|uniref:Uncharacterized protein n=1 Tax=Stylosanthes scabra TaxID=79078 RepID=A0ABU6Q5G4_9FABA|nr:hypothetical protein [Stylosanthes scabra]